MHDDLKKRKLLIEGQIQQQWVDQEKITMQVYDQKTTKKLEEEYKKKMINAKVIKNQLYDSKVSYMRKMKEEKLEGEIIKR